MITMGQLVALDFVSLQLQLKHALLHFQLPPYVRLLKPFRRHVVLALKLHHAPQIAIESQALPEQMKFAWIVLTYQHLLQQFLLVQMEKIPQETHAHAVIVQVQQEERSNSAQLITHYSHLRSSQHMLRKRHMEHWKDISGVLPSLH